MTKQPSPSKTYEKLARMRQVLGIGLPLGAWCDLLLIATPLTRFFDRLGTNLGTTLSTLIEMATLILVIQCCKPLVAVTLEASARFGGLSLDELEPAPGPGRIVGLTEKEPWWMVWILTASGVALSTTALVFGGLLAIWGHLEHRPPAETMSGTACLLGAVAAIVWIAPAKRLFGDAPSLAKGDRNELVGERKRRRKAMREGAR